MTRALLALGLCGLFSCDPVPRGEAAPPGGFAGRPDSAARSAVRAVLLTPSHGHFRTVREAMVSYLGSVTDGVQISGWSAARAATGAVPHYDVDFSWFDGERGRQAQWEINAWGIWPVNDESRLLSVFPPEDGH